MKIGDFARACGTKISVLRHYDKIGLLKPLYIDRFTEYRYSVALVDLSSHQDLYEAITNIRESQYFDELHKEHIIFDNVTKTVWLQWYNESVAQ
jgi:hypothetical protein